MVPEEGDRCLIGEFRTGRAEYISEVSNSMHVPNGNKSSDSIASRCQKPEVMEHIIVRPLNGNDSIAEITDLLHRAFARGPRHPYDYPAAKQNCDTTAEQVQRGRGCVAVINGSIVGLGIVWPPAEPATRRGCPRRRVAHLRQLAVEPDLQKMGLGTAILDACERTAVEMGASELSGSAPIGSQQLLFYKRRGYRPVRYTRWSNTDYDSIIFAKRLKKNDRLDGVRFLVEKVRYLRSFVTYEAKQLLRTTAVAFGHVAGTIGIPGDLQRKAGKLFTKDAWKRRFRLFLTARFWKAEFMALPVLRWFCWITRSLTRRQGLEHRAEILLHCPAVQCAEHLRRFAEVFSNDPRLRFVVMFEWYAKKIVSLYARMRKILPYPEVSNLRAYLQEWDMVVVADHPRHELSINPRKCPVLYIGHGEANKSTPSSTSTRPYGHFALKKRTLCTLFGKRQPLYARMFAAEEKIRDLAVRENPLLKDRIVVVGNLVYDSLLGQVERREYFRRELGIEADQTAVLVLSTWRDECLFRSVGDAFLAESRKLLGTFRFILSIHPNEYLPRPSGDRVWGEYVRTQRQYGYIVREPEDDFVPYLVASDIVLSDHTCLVEYAALLQKPIICVPVKPDYIWNGSVTWEIFQFTPILSDMCNLREALLRVKANDYPLDRLKELALTMNPHPGQTADRIRDEVYAMLKMRRTNSIDFIGCDVESDCNKGWAGETKRR